MQKGVCEEMSVEYERSGKTIPGANVFHPEQLRSELTISVEKLEELLSSKLGTGCPQRFSFGESGHQEVVDFKEIIGVHVSRETKKRTPTSIGVIHYSAEAGCHLVPVHPSKIEDAMEYGSWKKKTP